MPKLIRLLADVDPEIGKGFKKALIDDEVTYKEWLLKQINLYLKKKGGVAKKRRKK